MEQRPEFTVIAGPNGAGKSRLCPFYVSAKSFDGDKLRLELAREHPDWPDRWVNGTVASILEKQKTEALDKHECFAFETNFSNDLVLHMIEDFRAAEFKISLCYFGLYSEDESVSRVIHRVQTGGHDVSDDVIRFNFHEGLKNVQQHLTLFDNLTFIDGNSDYGHVIALHIGKSQTHKVVDNPPQWFKEQFEELFKNFNI